MVATKTGQENASRQLAEMNVIETQNLHSSVDEEEPRSRMGSESVFNERHLDVEFTIDVKQEQSDESPIRAVTHEGECCSRDTLFPVDKGDDVDSATGHSLAKTQGSGVDVWTSFHQNDAREAKHPPTTQQCAEFPTLSPSRLGKLAAEDTVRSAWQDLATMFAFNLRLIAIICLTLAPLIWAYASLVAVSGIAMAKAQEHATHGQAAGEYVLAHHRTQFLVQTICFRGCPPRLPIGTLLFVFALMGVPRSSGRKLVLGFLFFVVSLFTLLDNINFGLWQVGDAFVSLGRAHRVPSFVLLFLIMALWCALYGWWFKAWRLTALVLFANTAGAIGVCLTHFIFLPIYGSKSFLAKLIIRVFLVTAKGALAFFKMRHVSAPRFANPVLLLPT
eukprot:2688596-Rhodomonas_salina.5